MKQRDKFGLLVILVVAIAYLLIKIDYFSIVNLGFLKSKRAELILLAQTYPLISKLGFFTIYLFLATFSIPGAVFMVLLSPSLFNLLYCYLLAVFASTAGGTLSFLLARFFLQDWVRSKFHKLFTKYNKQILENEKSFLVSLRLIPVLPFSWVNLIYSVSPIKTKDFFWLTLIGMTPGILVNLYAGLQLSEINKMSDLYSAKIIFAFLLMAIFPIFFKPFTKKFLG